MMELVIPNLEVASLNLAVTTTFLFWAILASYTQRLGDVFCEKSLFVVTNRFYG
jgi:hypothetical protein